MNPNTMKVKLTTSLTAAICALGLLAGPTAGLADQKDVTITGEGSCMQADPKEVPTCRTIITTKKNGKTTKYYVADNDVSKKFHSEVCAKSAKVTATGTVKELNGKSEFTAKKIELVKE